jgi:hypothetical protein
MYALASRGNILGQFQPFVTAPIAPSPVAAVSAPAGGDGAAKAALVGGSFLAAALAGTSTAFTYGLARDSQSTMVKTTGYILAGIGALTTVAYLFGGPLLAALSGSRK